MRIEKINNQFVIVRGDENRPQYFSFYIDGDKSSWTKYKEQAHKHISEVSAAATLDTIRWRQRQRRENLERERELNPCTK